MDLSLNMNNNDIIGCVATNKVGSEVEFYVCERKEWESLSEEEQYQMLMDAAFESGIFEIYLKND